MELRKHLFPEAELVDWREGHTDRGDKRVAVCSGGVKDQRMCGHVSHGNRETSERRRPVIEHGRAAGGKVNRRNPSARASEESDGVVVPENPANKGPQRPAVSGEGRTPARAQTWTIVWTPDSAPAEKAGAKGDTRDYNTNKRGQSYNL